MKSGLRFALLLPATTLIGCALPSNSTSDTALTGAWQNWQIQQGAAITTPPTGLYFVGAVQAQGTQSAAIFATPGTGQPTPTTGNIILNFLGTYTSSTGAVDLFPATTGSPAYGIGFIEPSAGTVTQVGIASGCIYPLNYTGVECLALTNLSPAVGVEIAPLNGTYVGALTDAANSTYSGTATLALTQSATPNTAGQFPLSGTITFPTGSGFGTAPLAGTIAGEGITLSDPSAAPNSPSINFTGSASPAATQIAVNITYSVSGTAATFTGTLTRQ